MKYVCLVCILAFYLPQVAKASTDSGPTSGPTAVKSGVVLVTAKGVSTALGNVEVATQGTGFFTSKDGYLVTAYHLVDKLITVQQADPATVTFEIHFSNGDSLPASRVSAQKEVDMLILMAQISDRDVQVLVPSYRSKTKIIPGTTPVFTAGFPNGYQFTVDQGIIKSWGPTAPVLVWATSLNFKDGQSGSPILLQDNTVIAYAKADDADASTIGLVVPISVVPSNYWDAAHDDTSRALSAAIASANGGTLPTVVVSAAEQPSQPREKTQPISLANQTCAAALSRTITVPADSGWNIDPQSVQLHPTSVQGGSGAVISSISENKFDVAVATRNFGQCVRAFGKVVVPDQRGAYSGFVTYKEIPTAAASQPVTVSEFAAVPSGKQPIITNRNPDALSFKIQTPSGETKNFVPNASELKVEKGMLTLDTGKILNRLSM